MSSKAAAADQGIPQPPRFTRTELAVWCVYAVIAGLLVAIPLLRHHLDVEDLAAWVLLLGAAGMSAAWLRTGELRCQEWLLPEDYELFLKQIRGRG